MLADKRVIDTAAATGLARFLLPPSRFEHPLMQPFTRMPKWGIFACAFTCPEAVE
jgi:hypothetical protein